MCDTAETSPSQERWGQLMPFFQGHHPEQWSPEDRPSMKKVPDTAGIGLVIWGLRSLKWGVYLIVKCSCGRRILISIETTSTLSLPYILNKPDAPKFRLCSSLIRIPYRNAILMASPSHATSIGAATPDQGNPSSTACIACREKHLKCDGSRKCSRCSSHGIACVYLKSRRGCRGRGKHLYTSNCKSLGTNKSSWAEPVSKCYRCISFRFS